MAKFSKRSLSNLEGIHPKLIDVLTEAIKNTPIDFTIVEGVRTLKRQSELFSQGRTTKGNIVTYADGINKKSNHQIKKDGYGYAVDIYPYVDGKLYITEKETINYLTEATNHIKSIAKKLNVSIKCGIDWKKPFDPPHIELHM